MSVATGIATAAPTTAEPELPRPKGEKLLDPAEMLLRQVNPKFYRHGELLEDAFLLSSSDKGLLSVSQGSKTTPEAAFDLHRTVKKRATCGVWGVTVGECNSVALDAYDDPTTNPPDDWDDSAHASIDFQSKPKGDVRLKRKKLLAYAEERKPLYSPST